MLVHCLLRDIDIVHFEVRILEPLHGGLEIETLQVSIHILDTLCGHYTA